MLFCCFRLSTAHECEVIISNEIGSSEKTDMVDSIMTEASVSTLHEQNKNLDDTNENQESGKLWKQSYKCRVEVDIKRNEEESFRNNYHENNEHLMCVKVPSLAIYGPAVCDLCDETFTDMDEFDSHVAGQHLRKHKWQCLRCDDSFEQSQDLVLHKAVTHGEEPVSCGRCQDKKMKDENSGDEGVEEEWLEEMETHVDESRSHSNNNTKESLEFEFYCELCDKNFCDETKLKDHYLVHSPQSLVCSRCGLKCSSSHELSVHKRSHLRNVKERRYTCEVCRKTFFDRVMYNIHHRRCGNKQYTCNICDRTFWREYSLQLHMKVRLFNSN
jgi:hypothetical protein